MEPSNTTIYVVKQANSRPVGTASTERLAYPSQNRVFISQTVSEITEAGLKQIEALKAAFKGIKFDTIIYTPQNRTELTITPISDQQSEKPVMVKMEDWDEVRMGDLNGKAVGEIKDLYMKVFPKAEKPKTDNEAMNHSWGEEYDFEPYEAFTVRMRKVTQETIKKFAGQVICLCVSTENVRNLVMDSIGTEEFYQSEFGRKVIEKTGDSELFQKTLGQRGLNNRDDFKPNDASYMKLTAGPDGILRLHSVHDFTARW